jgi:hypothetical protein
MMIDNPDSMDAFLTASPPPCGDRLQGEVLGLTLRTVRWRRRWKRAGFVAALAACFAAGALTMRVLTPAAEPEVQIVDRIVEPNPIPAPVPEVPAPVVAHAASGRALEWQAVEDLEHRAELLRLAGDRYLNDENDMVSAVRCYKQALNAAPDEAIQITPQDNWLLISLKNARQEEERHGKSDS